MMSINSATVDFFTYTFDLSESIFYFQAGSAVVQSVTVNLAKVYTSVALFVADFNALLQTIVSTLTVTQNLNNGILTITNSAGGINVIGIANKDLNWSSTYYNNISDRLGFLNGSFTPLSTAPSATTFTASGPMRLLRTSSIFVGVDCIAGDSFTSNTPSECINNILFQLPVTNGTYGSVIQYFNNDFFAFTSSDLPTAIYNINVVLYDDMFNQLTLLSSARVMLELAFKYEKDKNPFTISNNR